MPSNEWFITAAGREQGPVSAAQLKQLAAEGKLKPDMPVRRGDLAEVVPASSVKGLFAAAPATPAPAVEPAPQLVDNPPPSHRPGMGAAELAATWEGAGRSPHGQGSHRGRRAPVRNKPASGPGGKSQPATIGIVVLLVILFGAGGIAAMFAGKADIKGTWVLDANVFIDDCLARRPPSATEVPEALIAKLRSMEQVVGEFIRPMFDHNASYGWNKTLSLDRHPYTVVEHGRKNIVIRQHGNTLFRFTVDGNVLTNHVDIDDGVGFGPPGLKRMVFKRLSDTVAANAKLDRRSAALALVFDGVLKMIAAGEDVSEALPTMEEIEEGIDDAVD